MSNFGVDTSKGTSNVSNPYDFKNVQQKPPPSSYGKAGATAMRGATGQQRLGTAMKSNASAGF